MPAHDFTAAEVLTSANVDGYLNNSYYGQFRQSVSQNFTDATFASLTFTTEDFDTDSGHDTVTNTSRYTAQTAGRYMCMGAWGLTGNAAGQRYVMWLKNGSAILGSGIRVGGTTNANLTPARTIIVDLAVGDYVEMSCHQNCGITLASLSSADTQSSMTVWRVSS